MIKRKAISQATSGDVAGGGSSSGWVDDSVPDLADILARNPEVDPTALVDWLGPRMGLYRSQIKLLAPSPVAARQYLEDLAGTAARMRELLGVIAAGPLAADRLHFTAKGMGLRWPSMRDRLRQDMADLEAVVLGAWAPLRGLQSARGRRPALPRDMLLADVVAYLRVIPMKADPARNVATEILASCGVDTPLIKSAARTRSTRRAESRGQKKA